MTFQHFSNPFHPTDTTITGVNPSLLSTANPNKQNTKEETNNNSPQIPTAHTDLGEILDQIQNGLKEVLEDSSKGDSRKAFVEIQKVTEIVVLNCELLGLIPDNSPYCAYDRDDFWRGLNESWMYAITCAGASLNVCCVGELLLRDLQVLRENVMGWADVLEVYGLVDYEMGFWEQDILDSIDDLMNQLKLHMQRKSSGLVGNGGMVDGGNVDLENFTSV